MRFGYTEPSPGRYPWQWYWDSCFAAIVWRRFEPRRARVELESAIGDSGYTPSASGLEALLSAHHTPAKPASIAVERTPVKLAHAPAPVQVTSPTSVPLTATLPARPW